MQSSSLRDYFQNKDKDFIGINKVVDEIFTYNATDVLVQAIWELPIVIQWPESVVNYKFTTQHGDISFGVMFVAAPEEDDPEVEDLEVETVEEISRVPSSTDSIEGSFQVPYEGVIFFLWDNNFDWSSVKKLSYHIEVKQPSFTIPDEIRSTECFKELKDVTEHLDILYNKQADAQDYLEHNLANVSFLQEHVRTIQQKLANKTDDLLILESEINKIEKVININESANLGLCIRSLNRETLSLVLSFVPFDQCYLLVCKYWRDIFIENEKLKRIQRSNHIIPAKALNKLSKLEIKRMLFDIQLQQKKGSSDSSSINGHHFVHSVSSLLHDPFDSRQSLELSKSQSIGGDSAKKQHDLLLDSSSLSDYSTSLDEEAISSISKQNISPHVDPASSIHQQLKPHLQVSADHLLPEISNHQIVLVKSKQEEESERLSRRSFKSFTQHKITANIAHAKSADQNEDPDGLDRKDLDHVGKEQKKAPMKNKKELLQHVQKIRSEQQLDSIIEYLNVGFNKIDQLNLEKRRIKKLIRAWNASYLRQHDRLPTSSERRGHLRELHEEYQQITLALKIRKEKMEETLKKVGLSKEEFEDIRNNKFHNW